MRHNGWIKDGGHKKFLLILYRVRECVIFQSSLLLSPQLAAYHLPPQAAAKSNSDGKNDNILFFIGAVHSILLQRNGLFPVWVRALEMIAKWFRYLSKVARVQSSLYVFISRIPIT